MRTRLGLFDSFPDVIVLQRKAPTPEPPSGGQGMHGLVQYASERAGVLVRGDGQTTIHFLRMDGALILSSMTNAFYYLIT